MNQLPTCDPRLSLQLYSVRDDLADLDTTLERIVGLGFDAVEPFNVLDESLRPALERHGLEAPSGQFPFLSDEIDFMGQMVALPAADQVFEAARSLGVDVLIDPMVSADRWRTRSNIERTADRLNAAADATATSGLRVGHHNHSFEFHTRFGEVTAYEWFVARLDDRVVLEIDVFWAAVAGQAVARLVREAGPRVKALHLKDGTISSDPFASPGGYEPAELDQRAIGEGQINIATILDAARSLELDVVEFDHVRGDVYAEISRSVAQLRDMQSGARPR